MSFGHHSVVIPEHSLQSLWPILTQSVLQTQNATCWGPCQLQSWVRRWMWVQEWPLTQSSSAGAMLYSHETSPACRIWVTLDTVYSCWCYAFICWNGLEVEGLLQVVFLEIPPNCICGEEYSSSPDQLHALCGGANLYSSTAILYKAKQLKDS